MYGSFNNKASEVWDFTRCQRPDGSFYGTSGKCRSGTEVAAKLAKVPKEKLKKLAQHPGLSNEQRQQVLDAIKKPAAPSGWPEGKPAAKEVEKPKKEAKPKAEPKPKAAKPTQEEKVKAAFDKMMSAPKGPEFEAAVKAYKKEKDKQNKAEGKPVEKPVAKKPAEKAPADKAKELAKQEKLVQQLAKKAKNAKSREEEDAAMAALKKEKAKLDEMRGEKKPAPKKPVDADAKAKASQQAWMKLVMKQSQLEVDGKKEEAKALQSKIDAAAQKAKKDKEAATGVKSSGAGDALIKKAAGDVNARQDKYDARQDQVNLPAGQRKALFDYTDEMPKSGFGYTQLNECARAPKLCQDPKKAAKMSKEMDAALAKLPKNDDGDAFFRGIYVGNKGGALDNLYNQLAEAKPGQRFKDPAFGSYSSNPSTAADFGSSKNTTRSILFVNRSKSLTPISTFSAIREENEALLPRGTEQTIRKVTRDGDQLIIELD